MSRKFIRVLTVALVLTALCFSFLNFSPLRVFAASPIQTVFSGLDNPDFFTFVPDGRIFYNEKNTGNIRVISVGGTILSTPFATVGPLPPQVANSEQGLLGIALDPNFVTNNFVYVYWTFFNSTNYKHVRITRFTAAGNTGNSPTTIFDFTDPNSVQPPSGPTNHNGGYIRFGPDGKLYAEVGDSCSWDCLSNPLAQSLATYAGKILRMNSDGSVPADNPFPGSLIYAYGYRNGVGMDFDSSGKLIATMAGPDCCDRIFFVSSGANFGWPNCGVDSNKTCGSPYTPSTYQWGSPTVTPTGIAYSSGNNVLYFGEFNTGNLMQLVLTATGTAAQLNTIGSFAGGVISVERGADGSIWFSTPSAILRYTPPTLMTVVRGMDNGIYGSGMASGSWDAWSSLARATASAPALCNVGSGELMAVARGTDGGIYVQSAFDGVWSLTWSSPGGATDSTPACAVLGGSLYVVVQGTDNVVYVNTLGLTTNTWSGWVSLNGATSSSPSLAASAGRLDLVVRGMDSGIYHKSFVSGSWSSPWDSPGGATSSTPACAVLNNVLYTVVQGTDNIVYVNSLPLSGGGWNGWVSLNGATPSSPSLVTSTNRLDLMVQGTDHGIYHKAFVSDSWISSWNSPGGATPSTPASTELGGLLYVAVQGTDNGIYVNTLNLASNTWSAWNSLSGATSSTPSIEPT